MSQKLPTPWPAGRRPLPPPPPPPRIYREGVGFLPYRGVSPLVWKTIRLINDDRLKEKL